MKWILFSMALAAASVFLLRERSTAAVLRADLEQHRLHRAELDVQLRDYARLLALQPTAGELAQLHRAVAERAERKREVQAAERGRREAPAASLPVGEWILPTQWQDRGQQTPPATVQTVLWAATGGDTARLATLMHFDESARAKLVQIYDTLPADARGMYASPEQLVAAFTAKAIPMGEAQIVWQQQSGADHAVACVWVNNPAPPSWLDTPAKAVADSKAPPMLPANSKRAQALLTMRRADDGWRVIVPVHAVDKLARELGEKTH